MSVRRIVYIIVFHVIGAAAASGVLAAEPTCDITGNWREAGKPFQAEVVTVEPPLLDGEQRTFQQEIVGLETACELEFDYFTSRDTDPDHPGDAIGGQFEGFQGLSVNGKPVSLHWTNKAGDPRRYQATCRLECPAAGQSLHLALTWRCTRPPQTRLVGARFSTTGSRFQALAPAESEGELMVAHGIPFLAGGVSYALDSWGLPVVDHVGGRAPNAGLAVPYDKDVPLDAANVEAKAVHFLGMIHVKDWGSGSWYTPKGDHGYSHFVGDRTGAILLTWADGTTTEIPLILGWNLWYSRSWDMIWHFNQWGGRAQNYQTTVFGGDSEKLQLVPRTLALVDGIRPRGAVSSNARFIFSVNLEGRSLKSVGLKGVPELYYGPLVSAVTVETERPSPQLRTLPLLSPEPPRPKVTTLDEIAKKAYAANVEKLMRLLYTFVDELPVLSQPLVPKGYFGPSYDFGPERDAVYAANLLYQNGPGCAAFIADNGMECSSPVFPGTLIGNYAACTGIWRSHTPHFQSLSKWFATYSETEPGKLGGAGSAWSRAIGEVMRESMAFGYDKFINTYTDWLDASLYNDTTPPHWTRCPGNPKFAQTIRKVGDVEERGNRENDGHGICMWGRAMIWHWLGRPRDWNLRHWKATEDSVAWLQWQLDTDEIFPGKRKDVLYTESECAHNGYDVYSSYNCLHGLKLAIRMADQLEKKDAADRWRRLYDRLRQGILDNLVAPTDDGPIWHTSPDCDWQDHAHGLVHLHLATEGDTYTPLQDYAQVDDVDRKYLDISRNTYRHLMRGKNYNCLRMYGYGQGMMTQAALLLDEMEDAEQFMQRLLRHAYLPHLGGWASPEGIMTHRSGLYYMAVNGYAGQDAHIADSTKAMRLMLGIDDNKPEHLRIIPRYPASWSHMAISDFPALTGDRRQKLAYDYRRFADRQEFQLRLERDAGPISIRLGPLPTGFHVASASINGANAAFREEASGDSRWVWLETAGGTEAGVTLELKADY